MPVTLVVRTKHASGGSVVELPPLTFDASRVVLGRGASCDVRLPDASVSSRHASIRAQGAGWVVVDEGSTNGSSLNGERLRPQSPRTIKGGDILKLGRIELIFKVGAAVVSSRAATQELAMLLVDRALGLGEGKTSHPTIRVVAGPDLDLSYGLNPLDGELVIGRDPRALLRLTDREVPPIALSVVREPLRTLVRRRDERIAVWMFERGRSGKGDDGTKGERPVEEQAVVWPAGSCVRLGVTVLELRDPLVSKLEASSHGDDELMGPEPQAPAEPLEPVGAIANEASVEPASTESASIQPSIDSGAEAAAPTEPKTRPAETNNANPGRRWDRRGSYRGATFAFEVVALIMALLVLGGSIAGLVLLLRR